MTGRRARDQQSSLGSQLLLNIPETFPTSSCWTGVGTSLPLKVPPVHWLGQLWSLLLREESFLMASVPRPCHSVSRFDPMAWQPSAFALLWFSSIHFFQAVVCAVLDFLHLPPFPLVCLFCVCTQNHLQGLLACPLMLEVSYNHRIGREPVLPFPTSCEAVWFHFSVLGPNDISWKCQS